MDIAASGDQAKQARRAAKNAQHSGAGMSCGRRRKTPRTADTLQVPRHQHPEMHPPRNLRTLCMEFAACLLRQGMLSQRVA